MRKISPHLNIYKFPITALSSITNRVTGLALTGYFIGLGTINFCPHKEQIIKKYDDLDWKAKKIINYGAIFPITYHTLGGIRHLIWDKYPHLLKNNAVKKSSLVLFAGSALSTVIMEHLI